MDEVLEALGHQRKVVLSASSFLVVADIVARSVLIAIVPRSIVHDRADRLQIMPPPIDIPNFSMVITGISAITPTPDNAGCATHSSSTWHSHGDETERPHEIDRQRHIRDSVRRRFAASIPRCRVHTYTSS